MAPKREPNRKRAAIRGLCGASAALWGVEVLIDRLILVLPIRQVQDAGFGHRTRACLLLFRGDGRTRDVGRRGVVEASTEREVKADPIRELCILQLNQRRLGGDLVTLKLKQRQQVDRAGLKFQVAE